MKKVLSVILALVMVLSVVSVSAFAADEYADFDGTIAVGETRPVNLPGLTQYSRYVFIQFVPENDGWYAISSDSRDNEDSDPYLELYVNDKESGYVEKVDDADSDTTDFYLEYFFEAGTTYYFMMGNYRGATVWDITLECLHYDYKDGECVSCGEACKHEKIENMFDSCPCGKTFDGEVVTLKDGKYEKDLSFEEDGDVLIKFAPEETGIFRAQPAKISEGTEITADPVCDVYDSQGNVVAYHDDISIAEGEENLNFDLVYEYEAGKVYFISLWNYQEDSEWKFTFVDISTHSFEVEVPAEDDETTTPDDGTAAAAEDDTNTDTNEGGTTTPEGNEPTTPEENEPTTETVVHKLTFVPQEDASCYAEGCTGYAYCAECEDFEPIGKYVIPMTDHFFDEDGNCMTEGCDEVDPILSCTHMCHSTGIMGTIWSVVRFFSWLFGIEGNRVCACSVEHW